MVVKKRGRPSGEAPTPTAVSRVAFLPRVSGWGQCSLPHVAWGLLWQ